MECVEANTRSQEIWSEANNQTATAKKTEESQCDVNYVRKTHAMSKGIQSQSKEKPGS